jgi:hypothetical protein
MNITWESNRAIIKLMHKMEIKIIIGSSIA